MIKKKDVTPDTFIINNSYLTYGSNLYYQRLKEVFTNNIDIKSTDFYPIYFINSLPEMFVKYIISTLGIGTAPNKFFNVSNIPLFFAKLSYKKEDDDYSDLSKRHTLLMNLINSTALKYTPTLVGPFPDLGDGGFGSDQYKLIISNFLNSPVKDCIFRNSLYISTYSSSSYLSFPYSLDKLMSDSPIELALPNSYLVRNMVIMGDRLIGYIGVDRSKIIEYITLLKDGSVMAFPKKGLFKLILDEDIFYLNNRKNVKYFIRSRTEDFVIKKSGNIGTSKIVNLWARGYYLTDEESVIFKPHSYFDNMILPAEPVILGGS